MRITVFGPTGAIGRYVVDAALERGHEVVAFARDVSRLAGRERVRVVAGDAADEAAVARAIDGADAVINALGPTSNKRHEVERTELLIRNILSGMDGHGVRRLVSLSGAAVTVGGEEKPFGGRFASAIVRVLARNVVAAKQREYEILAASAVDWTVVRPPRVADGPATGAFVAGDRLETRRVTAGDVGAYMVRVLDDPTTLRKAPYVSAPRGRGAIRG